MERENVGTVIHQKNSMSQLERLKNFTAHCFPLSSTKHQFKNAHGINNSKFEANPLIYAKIF